MLLGTISSALVSLPTRCTRESVCVRLPLSTALVLQHSQSRLTFALLCLVCLQVGDGQVPVILDAALSVDRNCELSDCAAIMLECRVVVVEHCREALALIRRCQLRHTFCVP